MIPPGSTVAMPAQNTADLIANDSKSGTYAQRRAPEIAEHPFSDIDITKNRSASRLLRKMRKTNRGFGVT
jgi:hypothetical protein